MNDSQPLADRVAVVTGGSSGIGLATVKAFLAAGAEVVMVARGRERLASCAESMPDAGSRLVPFECDVRDADSVGRLAEYARQRWGKVSILCNCAGVMRTGKLHEVPLESWLDLLATNVTGTYLMVKNFIPLMTNPSSIINLGSTAGLRPVEDFTAYTTTKAAVIHMTQGLALEYASQGIRVNCICPGVIKTPIHDGLKGIYGGQMFYEAMSDATPLGYLGECADVSRMALFLADPRSHWITGSVFVVDGGVSLI